MANVDGSGRQILIIAPVEGPPIIRAGCFRGTVEDFAARATAEGKDIYARIVPLVANNL
jgi:hypothetical protein